MAHDRLGNGAAVIGQRAIKRQPTLGHLRDETVEPCGRNKIEKSRGGHKIDRTIERELEVAREIQRCSGYRHTRRGRGWQCQRQQRETVVNQCPVLARGKMRSHRTQCRAGATGEIDN